MPVLPYAISCAKEAVESLKPGVLEAFAGCAVKYASRTSQRLEISSARRSLRHCARLMCAFDKGQLEAMYCRNGYPSYISEMVDAMEAKGRLLTEEEAYQILRNRSEGYVSAHLYGAAIDIASDGLADKALLKELLEEAGFRVLDETDMGVRCIHATYRSIEPEIIKE